MGPPYGKRDSYHSHYWGSENPTEIWGFDIDFPLKFFHFCIQEADATEVHVRMLRGVFCGDLEDFLVHGK